MKIELANATLKRTRTAAAQRWQWSLTTLLLLTAAIAAWTAWLQVRRESASLRREIALMEELARRLLVDDPSQFAVVEKSEMWYDQDRWEVFLPEGSAYVVNLATRDIGATGFAEAAWQKPIAPGRHHITWFADQSGDSATPKIVVDVDGERLIEALENTDWAAQSGNWWGSGSYDRVTQLPVGQPLQLQRRRFSTPGQAAGVLLWIERVP
jgi:hypothetical protein